MGAWVAHARRLHADAHLQTAERRAQSPVAARIKKKSGRREAARRIKSRLSACNPDYLAWQADARSEGVVHRIDGRPLPFE